MRALFMTLLAASCSEGAGPIEGKIIAVSGEVLLIEDGSERVAMAGEELRRGLSIFTGAASRAELSLRARLQLPQVCGGRPGPTAPGGMTKKRSIYRLSLRFEAPS